MSEIEEFLEHHGVKGMRWGVRRKRGADGRVSTEAKRADEILSKAKKHGRKSLTNKELGDLTKRLELERKFNQLNPPKPNPSKVVAKFILNIGTTAVAEVARNAAKDQVRMAIEGKLPQSKAKPKVA